jgi:hypothetical protein
MEAGNFFYLLSNFPELPKSYLEEALNSKYVYKEYPISYSASCEIFKESKLYNILLKQFDYVDANFLKVPSKTIYNWHMDKGRKCAINWPIVNDSKCLTLVKESTERQHIFQFEEVEYVNLKPTILNTTYPHSVINSTQTDRLILTVNVDEKCSYEELKLFLNTLDINEY